MGSLSLEELEARKVAKDKFSQKLEYLQKYKREFKNREKQYFKHEFSDKLVAMNTVENELHGKIDATRMLGPELSSKNKYFEDIQPIAEVKKIALEGYRKSKRSSQPGDMSQGPDSRRAAKRALEKEQREKMINTYKDRLLPRFKVWLTI